MRHRLIDMTLTALVAVVACTVLHVVIADSVASGVAAVCGAG
jgi:hypothetical protein